MYKELHKQIEKILGIEIEEISLQDVLRASQGRMEIQSTGEIRKWTGVRMTDHVCAIHLSKKMWEQDEETLKKLLDLIN